MNRNACLAPAFRILFGSAAAACLTSAGFAQVIHPDQMFGTFSPQVESGAEGNHASSDTAESGPDKTFERQMAAPENDLSGEIDMKMLKTPDSRDADEARESDRQSSVSY